MTEGVTRYTQLPPIQRYPVNKMETGNQGDLKEVGCSWIHYVLWLFARSIVKAVPLICSA